MRIALVRIGSHLGRRTLSGFAGFGEIGFEIGSMASKPKNVSPQ
jgi:hypothetical protein